jgi:hypothetical protein
MLEGRAEEAEGLAAEAVQRAEDSRAPRHVAKGLLLLGLAQVSQGSAEAAVTLRRSATFAESLGCLPLIWPSRALLGALVADDDPAESSKSLAAARSATCLRECGRSGSGDPTSTPCWRAEKRSPAPSPTQATAVTHPGGSCRVVPSCQTPRTPSRRRLFVPKNTSHAPSVRGAL